MKIEFKLKGKKLYLKYNNIKKPIYNLQERILNQLIHKLIYIDYYLIGEEQNQDGTCNIHCFIELKTPFETTSPTFFNIHLDGMLLSGDYKSGTRKKRIIEYIIQLENYLTNIEQLKKYEG